MLSAFRSKRKSKKTPPPRRIQPILPQFNLSSPHVVEIRDQTLTALTLPTAPWVDAPQKSPQVNVQISNGPWFPNDILGVSNLEQGQLRTQREKAGGDGGVSSGSTSTVGEIRFTAANSHEHLPHPQVESSLDLVAVEDRNSTPPTRKGAPAPIKIPNPYAKVVIQRSSDTPDMGSHPQPPATQQSARSQDGDDASVISGITLPGALIADAFSLTNENNRQSRYQRRITRQDSATLPYGENPLLDSPYLSGKRSSGSDSVTPITGPSSLIPPVPPLPPDAHLNVTHDAKDDASPVDPFGTSFARPSSKGQHKEPNAHSMKRSQARSLSPKVLPRPPSSKQLQQPPRPISPITEVSTPPASLSATPEQSREIINGVSPGSSPSRRVNVGVSGDQYLTPRSGGSSTGYSERSGEDIEQVLDQSAGSSLFRSTSPSSSGSGVPPPPPKRQSKSSSHLEAMPSRSRSSSHSSVRNSRPSLASVNSSFLHPSTLLPIGERSRFSQDTVADADDLAALPSGGLASPNESRLSLLPEFPESAGLSSAPLTGRSDIPDSAASDLLDHIVIKPGPVAHARPNALNPIQVVPNSSGVNSYDTSGNRSDSPLTAGGEQTFPETPSAFSPMFSATPGGSPGYSPALPSGTSTLARTLTMNRMGSIKSRHGRAPSKFLVRSSSHKIALTHARSIKRQKSLLGSGSSAPSMRASSSSSQTGRSSPVPGGQKNGSSPSSQRSSAQAPTPPPKSRRMTLSPVASGSGTKTLGAFEGRREDDARKPTPTTETPSPDLARLHRPPSHAPPPIPIPSRDTATPPPRRPLTTPPYVDESSGSSTAATTAHYTTSSSSPGPSSGSGSTYNTSPYTPPGSRRAPGRPPLPIGPRSRNATFPLTRDAAGSISSQTYGESSRRPSVASVTTSVPRFQPTPVKYKGFTMEAAKWTFTSDQLQSIVSRAIRQSAEPAAIRLLPVKTLDQELPQEQERLEKLQAELKTQYKLHVRKRNTLVAALTAQVGRDGGSAALRTMLDDLSDISASLDQVGEELYNTRDQIAQLDRLAVVHSGSALAMALRKLNTSFLKRTTEAQILQDRVIALEAERDEAWAHAQELAQDLDALSHNTDSVLGSAKSTSRRSSRVVASRKSSICVSKAGLRLSSSVGSSFSPRDVPPVPPIPRPLGIVTTDLADRYSDYNSAGLSSTSDTRAMAQTQRDICNMLGISSLEIGPPRARRASMVQSPTSPRYLSPGPVRGSRRPVSDIAGGHRSVKNLQMLEDFQDLLLTDRDAALAALALLEE
ncbi:hypothetical protein EWM64_g3755 [Hericium alpestre]|uniref:Uncharacterized protein n=1 Tax=Hericium alpestre TaxID=135208 RepID=A0A4Z0A316_9AGAM|nr:hypothetical protein EWM64_g3755 [Hericium alpestre]